MTATIKKLFGGILAVAVAVTMLFTLGGGYNSLTAYAADSNTATEQVKEYTGTDAKDGKIEISNALVGETYTVYKVFDASSNGTSISYKKKSGKTGVPTGFTEDASGNITYTGSGSNNKLTADDIAAIKTYLGLNDGGTPDASLISETVAKVENGTETSKKLTFDKLPYGYYYVTSSMGSVVAIDSTNKTAQITDKNETPSVDKTITSVETNRGSVNSNATNSTEKSKKAIAEVGSTVTYKAVVTFPAGYHNVVFHDKMSSGLSLVTSPDDDKPSVVLKKSDGTVITQSSGDVTIKDSPDSGDTLTISFKDGITDIATAEITYKAKVTYAALQTNPADNTAKVTYGNSQSTTSQTQVYNASLTVKKTDGSDNPLTGAAFKLKNKASGKYYKLTSGQVSWVDSENDATPVSAVQTGGTGDAKAEFSGLGSGTYTLIESTVPDGYTKAADKDITITAADSNNFTTDLTVSEKVKNQAGTTLPSTGGIGTTIFYILGAVIVAGAAFALVMRRRKRA